MRERLLSYLVEQGDMTESQKEIVGYGVSILFHNVITILVLLIGGGDIDAMGIILAASL